MELEPTKDVLTALAAERRPGQTSSASPPSTAGPAERGRGKLERKGVDAVVVNDISDAGDRLRLRPRTRSRS